MDGMLSQDEINALLNGMNSDADVQTSEKTGGTLADDVVEEFVLSDTEKDAVGEISNISMGTAATTLSSLLSQKVNITTPSVSVARWEDLSVRYDRPCVMLQICYREGIDGNNVLILKERDVKIITDLMMGGPGQADDDDELTELHLSAIGEAMNQMMGSAATSLSSMFNRKIDISPPVANIIDTYSDRTEGLPGFLLDSFVMVAFKMQIGDLIDSEIMQLYPIDFAKELLELFMPHDEPAKEPEQASEEKTVPSNNTPHMQPQMPQENEMPHPEAQMNMGMPPYGYAPQMNMGMPQMPPYGYAPQMPPYGYAPQMQPQMPQDVNVAPASFQPFSNDLGALSQKENIDLIMDVPLEVSVELGRTTKSIKDILEFSPGTIVELNKIAGEAIDVLVNGKYVAKGEVVVIEESFGVRITEIIKDK